MTTSSQPPPRPQTAPESLLPFDSFSFFLSDIFLCVAMNHSRPTSPLFQNMAAGAFAGIAVRIYHSTLSLSLSQPFFPPLDRAPPSAGPS